MYVDNASHSIQHTNNPRSKINDTLELIARITAQNEV
jgi:hypothetical protein